VAAQLHLEKAHFAQNNALQLLPFISLYGKSTSQLQLYLWCLCNTPCLPSECECDSWALRQVVTLEGI